MAASTAPQTQNGRASLSVESLSYVYGRHGVEALSEVTLTIARGEIAALLGPNGCGKSTMLRNCCGAFRPSRGRVLYEGQEVHSLATRERARRIAFVPQQVRVDFPFTVREVVMMGRAPHQGQLGLERDADARAVEESMARTRVTHLSNRRLSQLSGGEAQRVMLAQILAQEADLLILDEPTSHLDINFQAEIMDLLVALNESRGTTVLLSLHDLNLAALYCNRVFLLKAGRLHSEGTPADVLTSAALHEVYGAPVWVGVHPLGNAPLMSVLPRSARARARLEKEDGPRGGTKN